MRTTPSIRRYVLKELRSRFHGSDEDVLFQGACHAKQGRGARLQVESVSGGRLRLGRKSSDYLWPLWVKARLLGYRDGCVDAAVVRRCHAEAFSIDRYLGKSRVIGLSRPRGLQHLGTYGGVEVSLMKRVPVVFVHSGQLVLWSFPDTNRATISMAKYAAREFVFGGQQWAVALLGRPLCHAYLEGKFKGYETVVP